MITLRLRTGQVAEALGDASGKSDSGSDDRLNFLQLASTNGQCIGRNRYWVIFQRLYTLLTESELREVNEGERRQHTKIGAVAITRSRS